MAEDLISFGAWVRLRRQALVVTREELASRVGCAEVTIRKIESDERKPSPQVAELLAHHLGLAADQRDLFVRVARGMIPVAQLPPAIPGAPVVSLPTAVLPSPEASLPSGTVTFLFTDIEGSTRRWEDQPDAMRAALVRHDAILRQAIVGNGGHIFKTIGDACCAAFASAPHALAAAIAGQRVLRAEDWGAIEPLKVRMALHTGTAEPQAGDYLGQPLNRVARLLSAGHGRQILLSLATHELVRDHIPNDATLRDLGSHRLKDLVRSEPIFQVNCADLTADFPPLHSLDARSTNLPAQVNALIGRMTEIAKVTELLDRSRLVTLTGPGGTGKTRLALQIGSELLDQYADGVWFIDLAPVSDPEQITSAIAQTLGIPESPNRPIREGIVSWLRERQTLLILDNCEQVIVGAADLVAELLRSMPKLSVLATSRIPLRIAAEHEYPVAPLGLPNPRMLPPLDQLSQYDAVALFIARARAVRIDFSVTNANASAVAEICIRLDGLPLAIELAAARIRLFSLDQLLSRLISARMQTLSGGARDLPASRPFGQRLIGAIACSRRHSSFCSHAWACLLVAGRLRQRRRCVEAPRTENKELRTENQAFRSQESEVRIPKNQCTAGRTLCSPEPANTHQALRSQKSRVRSQQTKNQEPGTKNLRHHPVTMSPNHLVKVHLVTSSRCHLVRKPSS